MYAYYNEIDPYAAQWLRNLIHEGLIASGEVDERSIVDVQPGDLRGFRQCHFFAGIGVWSHALQLAGWPDDRPVWTGSCPCQPFSAAGKRKGTADARHLWPEWLRLIRQCRPPTIFGEQVDDAIGADWLDDVFVSLEDLGYACGAVDFPACSVGAPHIRQRLYFVGHSESSDGSLPVQRRRSRQDRPKPRGPSATGELADADGGNASAEREQRSGEQRLFAEGRRSGELADAERTEWWPSAERRANHCDEVESGTQGASRIGERGESSVVGDSISAGLEGYAWNCEDRNESRRITTRAHGSTATSGFWTDAEWIACRDGKARPAKPGIQQMADGIAESLGRVRPENVASFTEEIIETAKRHQADAGNAMLNVWRSIREETFRRPLGGLRSVQEAPVLLAFLRQLSDQGWAFSQGISCTGKETQETVLRSMRREVQASGTPCQSGLERQQTGEYPDVVRVLSSVLARHAQAAWGDAFDANAADTFPLIAGTFSRVGRLRAYGNAIVAPQAAEFIAAFMEI